tara:strand:+ start:2006 stop:5329 length:3324 start_codon:yes stop_codon:yes gene_type:complete
MNFDTGTLLKPSTNVGVGKGGLEQKGIYKSPVEEEAFWSVCPNALEYSQNYYLETVSLYQTIDVLCEGEIAGLCNQNGDLIQLTSDANKNEDGFQGIYLNDVAVKNTHVNTLNYNRVFADFRVGTEKQRALSSFTNPSLSFTNSVQTLNIETMLPGLNSSNKLIDYGEALNVFVPKGPFGEDLKRKNKININNKGFLNEWGHSVGAYGRNCVYPILDADFIRKVRKAERAQVVSIIHTITNDSCTDVQIDMKIPGGLMYNHSDGKISPSAVNFLIKTGYVGDELTIAEGGSVAYRFCGIFGKTNSGYTRSYNIQLPVSTDTNRDRFVKIIRTDQELGVENVKVQKGLAVGTISEIVNTKLTYPHSALMGMIFDGRAFSSPPTRRFDCKLTKVKVPNNYDPDQRTYNGNWDGQFSLEKKWTDNPAWCFYDLATNTRYGVSKFGFRSDLLDRWNLYSIAKYCDELVPTGFSPAYKESSFTIDEGGVIVTIDDSSTSLGEEIFKQRFPKGAAVCLYDTKNGAGTEMDKAYRRLIVDQSYTGTAGTNGKFTFKIVKIPTTDAVFREYSEVEEEFIREKKKTFFSAQEYLIRRLLDQQDSDKPYVVDYLQGEPLDPLITQGSCAVEFMGYLPLLEPRFSCNLYLDAKKNAFDALNDIASIFRGMIYWSTGYMFVANDQKKSAVMLFTNANVKDGNFVYSGSSSTSRSTAVQVRYNDASDSYKPKVEYIEDAAGIREYGYSEKEIIGLGITSRAQANRLAKWLLYTTQTETDTVQFSTGQEGSYLRPSDVIKIQDKLRTKKRYGGRVKNVNYAAREITLDEGIEEGVVGQKITVVIPKSSLSVRELNKKAEGKIKIAVEDAVEPEGLTSTEIDEFRQPQIKQFTVASVSETNVVTISETTDEDFNLLKNGYIWSMQNTATEYKIEEIEYRVLSVVENSSNEYQVTGMMYNESKFASVDRTKDLDRTQQSKSLTTEFTTANLPAALSSTGVVLNNDIVTITEEMKKEKRLPSFNASFPHQKQHLDGGLEDQYLKINFDNLRIQNDVTPENTGGYIVEVTKNSGERVRFALEGYDQTTCNVFLGANTSQNDINVTIYRYNTNYTPEDLGLGVDGS